MGDVWEALGIAPTKDISAIKRAYAEQAKQCHPEEDPEGFLRLRKAYQTALDYAEGIQNASGFVLEELEEEPDENPAEEPEWTLQMPEDDGPNPYVGGEAITAFRELYTGKQRKNPVMWMNYVTSGAFLDAAWDPQFTALLLRTVREVLADFQPNKECMTWLNVVYQFSGGGGQTFDGMGDILQIAALGPVPKTLRGNEFAILQSFLDYRHLTHLANAGRWDQDALDSYREILRRYASFYIRDRCEQRVPPDSERHPAGLRVFLHFFQREDLPEEVYREAWQRLSLKSALMGRAQILYGSLRTLILERVPGIEGEAQENFLELNRSLDRYLARIKHAPETGPQESAAFFQSPELQRALPVPRFLEQQLLVYSKWRREEIGAGLVTQILDYYRDHPDIPRAGEVVSALESDLQSRMAKLWTQEDREADVPEGTLPLAYRPFLRHWLNTAFYTAQDPDGGAPLLTCLETLLPYQESWSRRFTGQHGVSRTITIGLTQVELTFYPLHIDYRVDGAPVYCPCLPWEEVSGMDRGDELLFLLPITAAPWETFPEVVETVRQRLEDGTALPAEIAALLARCMAGHVCSQPPMELSMEYGRQLYTAVWTEDGEPGRIFHQTFSGRLFQEPLEPQPGETRPEAARRRLTELTSPGFLDLSRLRRLPWRIYFTADGREETGLIHPELLEPEEGMPEPEPVPPELLVTEENLRKVLNAFTQDELERAEFQWTSGHLVLRRDRGYYACLYFENSFGRGDYWYALLADVDMYRTVDGDEIVYHPFGMGKLPEYSLFRTAQDMMQHIDLVLSNMDRGQLESGGRGGWLWSCAVNLQNAKHKLRMAQQKLGGIPPWRGGRDYHLAKFVFSRFPSELESVDSKGERTVTALRSGSFGKAGTELIQFMMGKLDRVRLTWDLPAQGGGTELCHLVLLHHRGRCMMFWLQDRGRQALAYAADEPRWFLDFAAPAWLVHTDWKRLRNGIDLLLDDLDNIQPVLSQPGQFASVNLPYDEIRAALVHDPS